MHRLTGFFIFFAAWTLFAGIASAQDQASAVESYSRGIHLFFDGQYVEAARQFDAALAADDTNPVYYYFRGLCGLRQENTEDARKYFQAGGQAECTPKGAAVDIGGHLRRIQGQERLLIEEVRRQARRIYQENETKRQIALYGETLERQKERLEATVHSVVSSDEPVESAAAPNASDLPSVPPILPFSRGEETADISTELAETELDEVIYLKDEMGKISLSTSTQRRRRAREERLKNVDPAARPAADGTPFVDIFAKNEIFADGTPFVDPNEPVESEGAAGVGSSGPVPLFGTLNQWLQTDGESVPEEVSVKTKELFGDEAQANPFADKAPAAAPSGGMDPFAEDKKFTP